MAKAKTNPKMKSNPKDMKTLREKAMAELKKAKAKFMVQEKKVKEYTKENPEKALAIAAGIGAAIGAAAVAAMKMRKK